MSHMSLSGWNASSIISKWTNITHFLSSSELKFLRLLKTASTSKAILKLKEMETKIERGCARSMKATPPPAPPPPPPFWAAKKPMVSVTNQEIAKYWRKKRVEEEDHLLAAIKAAARIRARNLTGDDYKRFEESLEEYEENKENDAPAKSLRKNNDKSCELRVGIKDWWTKSKYAYLNQPASQSGISIKQRRRSTYIPNLCCYKLIPPPTTSFGIF